MKKILPALFVLSFVFAKAQNNLNLVPMPAEVKMGKGNFSLSPAAVILVKNGVDDASADFLNHCLQNNFGFSLKKVKAAAANYIQLTTLQTLVPGKEGAYTLTVNKGNISISGQTASGTFYGMQTLLQLLPVKKEGSAQKKYPLSIPQLSITDYPRFSYRGMHLDVGRHYFPVSFVKKYIDYLATYKFNTFHWHLTEDQGWRIEIKKYPNLTKVGACRNRTLIGRYGGNNYDSTTYCGYYTQEEVKDIVQYATDRYITVIPEIEMPGHSTAALASYPYLGCTKGPYKVMDTWGVLDDVYCAGNDSTFTFLQNVLDEVMQLFPSKYIHIGGDECPKERWKKCPLCQLRIKNENLKDEHGLQSYFISRIEKYINSRGRNIIGWDEILEGGLAPNATVMSWRGEEGGIEAARQNHDVIMTPGNPVYFDHSQTKNEDSLTIGGYNPLEAVYNYEPIPAVLNAEQAKHVLGAQANVWTEYMSYPGKVEYMIFPRIMALSEVLWSPAAKRNWNDFERRLPVLFERLDAAKINYSKAYYDINPVVLPSAASPTGIAWQISSKNKNDALRLSYTGPLRILLQAEGTGKAVIPVTHQGTYTAMSKNSGVSLSQTFKLNKATGKEITLAAAPAKNYPGDGAFTLVNGVQNEKGTAKSSEFLGFLGKDLDATIDLGQLTDIKKVTLHALGQPGSWIYLPSNVEVQYIMSLDTGKVNIMAPTKMASVQVQQQNGNVKIEIPGEQSCRYIRVVAKNFGAIPTGRPGAGTPAWLFVDEIEVE